MDQTSDNDEGGKGGDMKGGKKKSGRGDDKKDCQSCKNGNYIKPDNLTAGIAGAIAICPPEETGRRYHLLILQRVNALRPNGADITRRTQAAMLNDLTDTYEPMPSDDTIIGDGDRSHNHLWYSALIRHGMRPPAEWEEKPHILARIEKLKAVWEEAKNTPSLRMRPAKKEAAQDGPAEESADKPDSKLTGKKRKRSAAVDRSARDEEEDAERELEEALQASRSQPAHPTRVPSARSSNQSPNHLAPPFAGHTTNSADQIHGYQAAPWHPNQPNFDQEYAGTMNPMMFSQHHEPIPTPLSYHSNGFQRQSMNQRGALRRHQTQTLSQNASLPSTSSVNQQLMTHAPANVAQLSGLSDLQPGSNSTNNGFTFGNDQLSNSHTLMHGGFGASPLAPGRRGHGSTPTNFQSQHRIRRMSEASHQSVPERLSYLSDEPQTFDRRYRPHLLNSQPSQSSFETQHGALGYTDGSTNAYISPFAYSTMHSVNLANIPWAPSAPLSPTAPRIPSVAQAPSVAVPSPAESALAAPVEAVPCIDPRALGIATSFDDATAADAVTASGNNELDGFNLDGPDDWMELVNLLQ